MDRRSYRTEIVIAADRHVTLVLPPDLPEGPAVVTVVVGGAIEAPDDLGEEGPDRGDMEWWEEFDHEDPRGR